MKKKLSKLLILLGIILIVIVLILIINYKISDKVANDMVSSNVEKIKEVIDKQDIIDNDTLEMPIIKIEDNDYIGLLSIPKLGKILPVMNTWSYSNLKISPCRYYGSVYTSDLVIAAHNYNSHFGSINKLEYGDEVIFTDTFGVVYTYTVSDIEVLNSDDTEKMINNNYDLTLYTCNILGTKRITVRCLLKSVN